MKRMLKIVGLLLGVAILLAAFPAYRLYVEIRKSISEDPTVYAEDIADLVAQMHVGQIARDEDVERA